MNELQLALIVIGVAAVAGIFIYNRLQERKYRKQTEEGFAKPDFDALMDKPAPARPAADVWGDEREPVFNSDDATLGSEPGFAEPIFNVDMEPIDDNEAAAAALTAMPEELSRQVETPGHEETPIPEPSPAVAETAVAAPPYSELIEFRVQFKSLDGMASEMFGELLERCRALGKPVRWRALPLGIPEWEVLQPKSRKKYLEVMASMQLADRGGAAGKDELAHLCKLAEEAAQSHGWKVKCDDVVEAIARAQSLDKFCADVDVLIGLNITARGNTALSSVKVRMEAEAAGLHLQDDGAYHLLDSRKETLYTLSSSDQQAFPPGDMDAPQTKSVTLLFDVPRVPDGLKAFDGMVALGRKISHEAGGLLVDDNQRPLTDQGIEKIRAQLIQIYEKMESRGIPPGGRLALRLFA